MALLYPWATKEYLLWHMSIGQIMLYFNLGIEMKYGKKDTDESGKALHDMSYEELTEWRREQTENYGAVE